MLVATTQPSPCFSWPPPPEREASPVLQKAQDTLQVYPAPRGHKDTHSHPYLLSPFLCSAQGRESHSPAVLSVSTSSGNSQQDLGQCFGSTEASCSLL